jgi:hypothetical protein
MTAARCTLPPGADPVDDYATELPLLPRERG